MLKNKTIQNERKEKIIYRFPSNLPVEDMEAVSEQTEIAAIKFVQSLGIRSNLAGYHLLIKAITKSLTTPDLLTSLTKKLYPTIASENGVSVNSVEQNIRRAIDSAYEYDPDRMGSIFYYKVSKPFVSEVLSVAVETIRYGSTIKNYN